MKTLRELRELANFSLEDVANHLNISEEKVKMIENGDLILNVKMISELSKLYKRNIGEIMIATLTKE